jgi:hypothetical protein
MKGYDASNTFGNFHLPARFDANRPGLSFFFFGDFLKIPQSTPVSRHQNLFLLCKR